MNLLSGFKAKLKDFFTLPILDRQVPVFHHDYSLTLASTLSVREQQKMHAEQMSMMAAQIDEQRMASQYNLVLINRTLIVAVAGTLISASGTVIAIFALVISSVNG